MTHPSSEEGWSSVVGRLLNMCKTPKSSSQYWGKKSLSSYQRQIKFLYFDWEKLNYIIASELVIRNHSHLVND